MQPSEGQGPATWRRDVIERLHARDARVESVAVFIDACLWLSVLLLDVYGVGCAVDKATVKAAQATAAAAQRADEAEQLRNVCGDVDVVDDTDSVSDNNRPMRA